MSVLHEFGRVLVGSGLPRASVGSLLRGDLSPAWLQAGVTAFSVLLTAGLVYLYHEQRKLDALEYTADVRAEGHRPTDHGDIDVCISNLGRGAATGLSLLIETSFPSADGCSGLTVQKTPIKRLQQPNAHDVRNEWARSERNYVGPEQYFVRFWTPVPVEWVGHDGDVDRAPLSELANELPDAVDSVRLTITLDYRDQSGNEESERIVDDVLPLKSGENLEHLFSRGMTYDQYERRKASEESTDPFESLVLHRPQLTDGFRSEGQNGQEDG